MGGRPRRPTSQLSSRGRRRSLHLSAPSGRGIHQGPRRSLGHWPRCPTYQLDKSRPSTLPPSGRPPSVGESVRERASRAAHLRIRTSRSHTVRGAQAPGRNVPGWGPAPILAACLAPQVQRALRPYMARPYMAACEACWPYMANSSGTHRPYMAKHHKLHGHIGSGLAMHLELTSHTWLEGCTRLHSP